MSSAAPSPLATPPAPLSPAATPAVASSPATNPTAPPAPSANPTASPPETLRTLTEEQVEANLRAGQVNAELNALREDGEAALQFALKNIDLGVQKMVDGLSGKFKKYVVGLL